MPASGDLTLALANDIAGFTHDPLGYVLYNFPWGVPGTPLEKHTGPRKWQRETLERLFDMLGEDVSAVKAGLGKLMALGQGVAEPQ